MTRKRDQSTGRDPINSELARLLAQPRRVSRTDTELEARIEAVLVELTSEPSVMRRLRRDDDEPLFESDARRRAAVSSEGRFSERQVQLLSGALRYMSFEDLWGSFWLLEHRSQRQRERAAREEFADQRLRARAAWRTLRNFATAVEGLIETATERGVLDGVEHKLVIKVAHARRSLREAKVALLTAQHDGKRTTDGRRQRIVRALRARLTGWTWLRIAQLILASSQMKSPPCPKFVHEHKDVKRLVTWLRQRVRDRSV